MKISSKMITSLFLLGLLFVLNGCMTNFALRHATGTSRHDYPTGTGEVSHYEMHVQPQPAYYCLLPLTIPADVVTSPFQLVYYLGYRHGQGAYRKP